MTEKVRKNLLLALAVYLSLLTISSVVGEFVRLVALVNPNEKQNRILLKPSLHRLI